MRTPNTTCIVCSVPLYRRPFELAQVRYVVCMAHRAQMQKSFSMTEAQRAALSLGRAKGTNHRTGYRHREESKHKASASHKAFCASNPEAIVARGKKTRGALHYKWKGGISKLNLSIRQMTENRKWMDGVKARDGKCTRCGGGCDLEAHHKVGLAVLIERLGIKSRDDARHHASALWAIDNGITLCQICHYHEHGRKQHED